MALTEEREWREGENGGERWFVVVLNHVYIRYMYKYSHVKETILQRQLM
jgi:hypothetical protein